MFVERKIISRMRGEKARQFDCIEGWRHLVDAVQTFGETHEFTKLVPNLTDKNPDDYFSSISYEKGFMLSYHLEEKLGGIEVFDKYLMAHVKKFDSKSFDTDDWKSFLYEYFHDKVCFSFLFLVYNIILNKYKRKKIESLDKIYNFGSTKNAEILFK